MIPVVVVVVVGATALSSLVVSIVITDETAAGPLLSFVTTILTLISVTYIYHITSNHIISHNTSLTAIDV